MLISIGVGFSLFTFYFSLSCQASLSLDVDPFEVIQSSGPLLGNLKSRDGRARSQGRRLRRKDKVFPIEYKRLSHQSIRIKDGRLKVLRLSEESKIGDREIQVRWFQRRLFGKYFCDTQRVHTVFLKDLLGLRLRVESH